ncbi:FkbM family methyltransferase [Christiangramia sp. LLG6405-1]|uniref:FkbM family methyltransferase n=1 Tax=Christiangramia sp. LLG6405-1 TaxID=3160832 RepID=UPI0038652CB2
MKKLLKIIPYALRERMKLIYYNFQQPNYEFGLKNQFYKTDGGSWSIYSTTPLYFLIKEIERYEEFYKIRPNDNIIDAGAFNGILSLVYSEKAKYGNIFSFEPDRKNLKVIEENFNLNNFPNNINLINKGLWSETCKVNFFEDGSVASSSFYKAEHAVEVKIPVITIDDFISEMNITDVSFIKMDVEGAELNILKGARQTLLNLNPNLSIATYHVVDGELTYKSVEKFFKEIDYPFKTVFFPDGEIITYAGPEMNK